MNVKEIFSLHEGRLNFISQIKRLNFCDNYEYGGIFDARIMRINPLYSTNHLKSTRVKALMWSDVVKNYDTR